MDLISSLFPDLQTSLSTGGLLLDIIGAVLIFKYGLPEAISRGGKVHLVLTQKDEHERRKAKKYDFISRIGLVALIVGFTLQLLSNYA